jgi:hypothetical protein
MRGRGGLSCRLTPASPELTLLLLSQARPLDGLHRVAPLPFRTSYFTSGLHPPNATVQRLIAYLYKRRSYRFPIVHSFHLRASWRTSQLPSRRSYTACRLADCRETTGFFGSLPIHSSLAVTLEVASLALLSDLARKRPARLAGHGGTQASCHYSKLYCCDSCSKL